MKGIPSHYSCEEIDLMTNEQKSRIGELRRQGLGYKRIAKELGLCESTVKTFCHRNDMSCGSMETAKSYYQYIPLTPCRFCGTMVPQYPARKEKKFCSDSCRNKWWNAHLSESNRDGMSTYTCPACGRTFSAYGKRNRKYCSHACYIADRFGGAK